jgi:PAS domain S-box-containing protein
MSLVRTQTPRTMVNPGSPFHVVILVCLVAFLSYFAARVGGALVLRPQMVWPLWPGCALLVAVLLLLPRKMWPIAMTAGLAGFVFYDLRVGLTLRTMALLILADTVEILIAALGISYCFDGVPRLDSIKSLAKFSFFAVILAPTAAAFIASVAFGGSSWIRWRIGFFTEALALFTLTPAILGWVCMAYEWERKSLTFYLEAAALIAGVILFGYIAFVAPGHGSSPVFLYSSLPFLLWSALRFGSMGISSTMIAIAFLSIWGAVHGSGPFTGSSPFNNVLSLQLFLLFAGAPFMILAALVEERKQAEEALRESEKRFRLVADTAPALIWMSGVDKLCTYFNESWLNFTGRSMDAELGNGWAEGIHPEDSQSCLDTYNQSFDRRQKLRMEYRLRRHDGEYRWILDIGVPRFNAERSFTGYIGIGIDVTDRKLAEAALASVSQRLIEAQEQERTRIARELHDDLGQRLALLANELEQLQDTSPAEVRNRMGALRKRTSEITAGIQSLSHELHSSKLEYLGMVAAMRSFCKEFGEQQSVEIDFRSDDLPGQLPPDVSLCLFRVLQEALHNSAKHSGVRFCEVRTWAASGEIHLTVKDLGSGFDTQAVRAGRGLGLISMAERVKLVNGTLSIDSQPKCGTMIHASVRISSSRDSMRASG